MVNNILWKYSYIQPAKPKTDHLSRYLMYHDVYSTCAYLIPIERCSSEHAVDLRVLIPLEKGASAMLCVHVSSGWNWGERLVWKCIHVAKRLHANADSCLLMRGAYPPFECIRTHDYTTHSISSATVAISLTPTCSFSLLLIYIYDHHCRQSNYHLPFVISSQYSFLYLHS